MAWPDLHLHSTASDGTLAPAAIVEAAARVGCPAIALTDHDTVGGLDAALSASRGTSVTVIPAVELSAGVGDRGIHVLGYHIDHTNASFLHQLESLRAIRVERAERMVSALSRDGYAISLEELLAVADGGAVGRAHIAQLLVASGHAASIAQAFAQLLGSSAPYYVPKPVSPPREVIGWIEDAGGVAVLAHPGLSRVDDLIPLLVDAGIVGIEAYHAAHDAEATARYRDLAHSLGLIVTGGSDYHGLERQGEGIGSVEMPESVVADLTAAWQLRGGRP